MKDNYLITGGAGFIGTNLADHYLANNKHVTIFDNFSRAGSEKNAQCLQQRYGNRLTVVEGDIRQTNRNLLEAVEKAEVVFHLAGQVAVTTSVINPRADFEANAFGTFNVLEAVRLSSAKPILVYSSTNKVYGKMADLAVVEGSNRYAYKDLLHGISEMRPLDFYSPYGCSKGAGDQYMIDYARIYGLKTIIFRQSCIYGPHQFGIEDQGWIAWFAIRAMQDLPVVIFGDGKQVRDVLYIEDLMAAYDMAVEAIARTAGQAYNIGGGPQNILSLLELIDLLEQHFGHQMKYSFDKWRPGDQLIFVSDIRKAKADFGWEPQRCITEGVTELVNWLRQNETLFT
jgi:CDP-paratose 2-epimerase